MIDKRKTKQQIIDELAESHRRIAELEAAQSEFKQPNGSLKELEKKYSTLVENNNDGIIIIQDGLVKFANSRISDMAGLSLNEIVGKSFIEFVSQEHKESVFSKYKKRVSGMHLSGKYEIEIVADDSRKIPVEINANLIEYEGKPADMAIIRDLTGRKQTEETLKQAQSMFEGLANSSPIGLYIVQEGKFRYVNPRLEEILGHSKDELIGQDSLFYVCPEDREKVRENAVHTLKDGSRCSFYPYEYRAMCKSGELKWIIETVAPIQYQGKRATLGNFMDITERKKAEEELDRLNKELSSFNVQLEAKVEERTKQLEEAAMVARAANQAKSDFLASTSHELRTPLNSIIGFSQVLGEQYFGNLNDKQLEYVNDIVDSGKHLLSLINDILDLSKIEAGKMELELSSVKIKDLLQNSLVMVKEKALAHNLNLAIWVSKDIEDLEIVADERGLKQVMFNLLSNAAKFTPDNGSIKVEARRTDDDLVVSVSDSGIGITGEEQKRIFEVFYQAKSGLKDKTPGTGLGLSITKGIVEKHNGRIWLESEGRNTGSRFVFTIPIVVQ